MIHRFKNHNFIRIYVQLYTITLMASSRVPNLLFENFDFRSFFVLHTHVEDEVHTSRKENPHIWNEKHSQGSTHEQSGKKRGCQPSNHLLS